jgi:hypothetical protein
MRALGAEFGLSPAAERLPHMAPRDSDGADPFAGWAAGFGLSPHTGAAAFVALRGSQRPCGGPMTPAPGK